MLEMGRVSKALDLNYSCHTTAPYVLKEFIHHNNMAAYEDVKNVQECVKP
jgi:hypothetical protein